MKKCQIFKEREGIKQFLKEWESEWTRKVQCVFWTAPRHHVRLLTIKVRTVIIGMCFSLATFSCVGVGMGVDQ